MSDTSKVLFKGSALRFFTLMSNIAVGFFMMPFLIHRLGDDQYGIWVLVGAVIGFYGLLDLGMNGAIVRFLVRAMHGNERDEVNTALSSAVFLFAGIGALSLVITILVVMLAPFFMDEGVNRTLFQLVIAILGIKSAILFPLSSFQGVLTAKYRFDITCYIQLTSLFIRTAVIVYYVGSGYGLVSLALIMAADALLVALVTLYVSKRLAPDISVAWSYLRRDKLKEYYHYGKYTYVATLADKIRFSIDDFVVAAIVGLGAVTHYTIAVTLLNYFSRIMASLFGVIAPVLNKYHKLDQWDNLRRLFLVATELTAISAILFGGLLITLGESFIIVWMGEDYRDVYLAIVILTVSSVVAGAQRPSVAIMYAIAKHKYYAKITSIEAVVNLIISIILAHHIGIYGVALGTTIPLLFNKLVLQPQYTCKQLGLSVTAYYTTLGKYFAAGILIFAPAYIISSRLSIDTWLELFAAGFVITAIYIYINMKLLLNDNTALYLRRVLPVQLAFLLKKVNGQHV